jgi:hypothetical protein
MRIDPLDVITCIEDEGGEPLADGVPASVPIVQTSLFSFPTFGDLIRSLSAEHRHTVACRRTGLGLRVVGAEDSAERTP